MTSPSEGQRRRRGHGQGQRGRGRPAGGADREATGEGGVGPERAEEPLPGHLPGTERISTQLLDVEPNLPIWLPIHFTVAANMRYNTTFYNNRKIYLAGRTRPVSRFAGISFYTVVYGKNYGVLAAVPQVKKNIDAPPCCQPGIGFL